MALSSLNQRRWRNFKANRRAVWSLGIFSVLFVISLFAEFVANEKPIIVSYKGGIYLPVYKFYPETAFGGDFQTEAVYTDPAVQCLIKTGGLQECWDDPEGVTAGAATGSYNGVAVEKGWMLWPPIPYRYNTINSVGTAPSAPDGSHWLGTDDTARDVLARIIYGFRLSVLFALIVSAASSLIGIAAGAVQGYFGGRVDLIFQRLLEIWGATPGLYVIIILFAILGLHPLRLAVARWCGPGRVPQGAELRICPRRPRPWRARPGHHVPPHPAQRHGRHADLPTLHSDRRHRRACRP
jgi:microcin C transport system permease protein